MRVQQIYYIYIYIHLITYYVISVTLSIKRNNWVPSKHQVSGLAYLHILSCIFHLPFCRCTICHLSTKIKIGVVIDYVHLIVCLAFIPREKYGIMFLIQGSFFGIILFRIIGVSASNSTIK